MPDPCKRARFAVPQLVVALLASVLCAGAAAAEELLIGYVDVQALLDDAPQAKAAEERLEQEFSSREAEIAALADALREDEQRFYARAAQLGAEQRRSAEAALRERARDLRRMRAEFQQDLEVRRSQAFREFSAEMLELAREIAREDGYDLVFTGAVIYASKRTDMTERVRRRLEKRFRERGS